MEPEKVYSESEVANLIRRAAELQESQPESNYRPGVTGEELLRIASEAGIDQASLQRAIQEEGDGPVDSWRSIKIDRVLPVELRPDQFDAITEVAPPVMTSNPKTGTSIMSQIGNSLHGQVKAGWCNPQLKVVSRDGRTKMSLKSDPSTAIALSILWTVPAVFAPVIAIASPILGVVATLGFVVASLFTFKWGVKKSNEATKKVAKKIEEAILSVGQTNFDNLGSKVDVSPEQAESEAKRLQL